LAFLCKNTDTDVVNGTKVKVKDHIPEAKLGSKNGLPSGYASGVRFVNDMMVYMWG
jgi:hypothetical protein